MKENFNAALIRAIRETAPSGENLANALMDILCIGKEAVYRRLRGEVTFTFEEAGIIAHHYSLSLDRITGTVSGGTNQFSLGIPLADNPMAAYTTLLKRYRDFFENVQNDPSAEVSSATNIIPFTFYCGYEYLSRFRLYRWMYQHQPLRTHVPLSQITVHQQLTDLHLQLGRSVRQAAHTTFILDGKLFESFINEIRYFSDLHLISNDEREKCSANCCYCSTNWKRSLPQGNSLRENDWISTSHTWISRRLTVYWSKPALKWLFSGYIRSIRSTRRIRASAPYSGNGCNSSNAIRH